MKIERIVIIVFSILGLVAGMSSYYLTDLMFAIPLSAIIYLIPSLAMSKLFKGKKKKWFTQNSLITFILVWLVVWIFLYSG